MRWITGFLAGFLLLSSAALAGENRGRAVGTLFGWGALSVDRQAAATGMALFPQDVVQTGAGSGALVALLSGDSVTVAERSEVVLLGAGEPGFDLRRGAVAVHPTRQRPARGLVEGKPIVVEALGDQPAVVHIALAGGAAWAAVESGRVSVQGAGAARALNSGESARVALDAGQAATLSRQPTVGRVTQLIPEETMTHEGLVGSAPMTLNELVSEGDQIQTSAEGRVRIEMLEGSFLNVGPGSRVRVGKYQAAARHAQLELRAGHLRAEAASASPKPARFDVETPAASVTATNTVVLVRATAERTEACNAGGGAVLLHGKGSPEISLKQGECAAWPSTEAPLKPAQSAKAINRETALTSLAHMPSLQQIVHTQGAKQIKVASDAGAALLAAVGLGITASAKSSLDNATSQLNAATSAANKADTDAVNATNAAGTAVNVLNAVNNGLNNFFGPPAGGVGLSHLLDSTAVACPGAVSPSAPGSPCP